MGDAEFEEALAELTEDEIREHVNDVFFDSCAELDPRCLLCVAARRLGLWQELGVDVNEIWPELGDTNG